MKGFALVRFDGPVVEFWTGIGWTTDRRAALLLDKSAQHRALTEWRRQMADDPARDVWLVLDWGRDSERTFATRDDGVIS